MHCSCAMMSPSITSPITEEGADVDGAERDGAESEGGLAASDCLDRNYTSLRFTVVASMAHMKVKWPDKGKGTEKWRKIHIIAEGNMRLSWDAKSK